MRNFLITIVAILLLFSLTTIAQTDNTTTDSIKVGHTTSGWFYVGFSRLLFINTPAALDTTLHYFTTSDDTTSSNFKILTNSDGDTISVTLLPNSHVVIEPLKVFGLDKYFKIMAADTADATRTYTIGTGKY